MKRLLFLLPLVILLAGCNDVNTDKKTIDNVTVVRIDECQYIKASNGHASLIYSHKGNCDNPVHVYKEVKNEKKN